MLPSPQNKRRRLAPPQGDKALTLLNHLIERRTIHADWGNIDKIVYYDREISKAMGGRYLHLYHIIMDGLAAHERHDPQF